MITSTRTRSGKTVAVTIDDEIKSHQQSLFEKQYDELRRKYEKNEIVIGEQGNEYCFNVANCQSYKSTKDYPLQKIKQGVAMFDEMRLTLLVPMHITGKLRYIPFHLYTIKNVFLNFDKNVVSLRINFHTPAQ